MTVRQIIEKFGKDPTNPTRIRWENLSSTVKSLYEAGDRSMG